jgi:hypothetical protein
MDELPMFFVQSGKPSPFLNDYCGGTMADKERDFYAHPEKYHVDSDFSPLRVDYSYCDKESRTNLVITYATSSGTRTAEGEMITTSPDISVKDLVVTDHYTNSTINGKWYRYLRLKEIIEKISPPSHLEFTNNSALWISDEPCTIFPCTYDVWDDKGRHVHDIHYTEDSLVPTTVVSCEDKPVCIESDMVGDGYDGYNYYVKGNVTIRNSTGIILFKEDSCRYQEEVGLPEVVEVCCGDEVSVAIAAETHETGGGVGYYCPSGCVDGACVGTNYHECLENERGKTCSTEDNYHVCAKRGDSTEWETYGNPCTACANEKILGWKIYDCYGDHPKPTGCSDTDGGKDYYTKGVTYGWDDFSNVQPNHDDYCLQNSSVVVEGFCNENFNVEYSSYDCPNGCVDGACIQ